MKNTQVLLIEDDPDLRYTLELFLSFYHNVTSTGDPVEGMRLLNSNPPDILVVEAILPRLSGIEICRLVRGSKKTQHTYVIMITGQNHLDLRIEAFEAGADDFLAKPFESSELMTRIYSKAVRASQGKNRLELIRCGNATLDTHQLKVAVDEHPIQFSALEFKLLLFFVQNKGQLLTRKQILQNVWKGQTITERTIDTHLVRIRKKLHAFNHKFETFYSAGYTLKEKELPRLQF